LFSEGKARIREAEAADVQVIYRLLRQFAAETESRRRFSCRPDLLARYGFGISPRVRALLLEETGTAVGFAVFFSEFSTFRGKPGVYVQDLFILPGHRRRGYGERLIRAVMHIGERDWDATFLRLSVDRNNARAIAFYRQTGFREETMDRSYVLLADDCRGLRQEP